MSRDKDCDIVQELLRRVQSLAPGALDDHMAQALERQFKHEFGGDKHYIPRPPRLEQEKRRAIVAFCQEGKPVAEVVRSSGISRRTLYRALEKKT